MTGLTAIELGVLARLGVGEEALKQGEEHMSDEETRALIAEARQWANGHPNRRSGELMWLLADALEATLTETEWEYAMEDDLGISFVKTEADALDYASRQYPELNPRPLRRRTAGEWERINEHNDEKEQDNE